MIETAAIDHPEAPAATGRKLFKVRRRHGEKLAIGDAVVEVTLKPGVGRRVVLRVDVPAGMEVRRLDPPKSEA